MGKEETITTFFGKPSWIMDTWKKKRVCLGEVGYKSANWI